MKPHDIYQSVFVKHLFNEMAATYGITNYVSSFGFCERWRAQCVAMVSIQPGMVVCDLMTGMGECWKPLHRFLGVGDHCIALDFSPEMCRRARANCTNYADLTISLYEEDVFENTIPDASVDCVISCFGLKTFSPEQQRVLAQEIYRILKPGGVFSLLEISVPRNLLLRWVYMVYLKQIIPRIGRLFLGNPDNYRLLGIYTEAFQNSRYTWACMQEVGLSANYHEYFLGCASGVSGKRPKRL
jgi:demethylmenaquinone methyltransferase/2-methoxy-6-polyprenyl-1,4-benzoquinol methylase